ncbi:uncharacterized protein TNCV_3383311 [Trichonephila clavipes]|nr:uncharacterized protein TNCV_3383311 [Trichonephila clavipes]
MRDHISLHARRTGLNLKKFLTGQLQLFIPTGTAKDSSTLYVKQSAQKRIVFMRKNVLKRVIQNVTQAYHVATIPLDQQEGEGQIPCRLRNPTGRDQNVLSHDFSLSLWVSMGKRHDVDRDSSNPSVREKFIEGIERRAINLKSSVTTRPRRLDGRGKFGLAIHQNDHQARRRCVEWAQNEIAYENRDQQQILFSDEAHFWLNSYVNKPNCRIWSEANPQVYVETPLHPEKLTVWCALWAGGILLQKR